MYSIADIFLIISFLLFYGMVVGLASYVAFFYIIVVVDFVKHWFKHPY